MDRQEVYQETEPGVFSLDDIGQFDIKQAWRLFGVDDSELRFRQPRSARSHRTLSQVGHLSDEESIRLQYELISTRVVYPGISYEIEQKSLDTLRKYAVGNEEAERHIDALTEFLSERRQEMRDQRVRSLGEAAVRNRNYLYVLVHSEMGNDNLPRGYFGKLWGVASLEEGRPIPVLAGKDGSLGLGLAGDDKLYPRLYHGSVK